MPASQPSSTQRPVSNEETLRSISPHIVIAEHRLVRMFEEKVNKGEIFAVGLFTEWKEGLNILNRVPHTELPLMESFEHERNVHCPRTLLQGIVMHSPNSPWENEASSAVSALVCPEFFKISFLFVCFLMILFVVVCCSDCDAPCLFTVCIYISLRTSCTCF